MQRIIEIKVLAPGIGEHETVGEQIDIILAFAQYFGHERYHEMAQELAPLAEAFGDANCATADPQVFQTIFARQEEVLYSSYEKIQENPVFLNRVLTLAGRMDENPDHRNSSEKAQVTLILNTSFNEMFAEIIRSYGRYPRWIANILWSQDNWFADMLAKIHWQFMSDTLVEVNTWRIARQVSFAMNCRA